MSDKIITDVHMQIDVSLLNTIKDVARKKGVPYQILISSMLYLAFDKPNIFEKLEALEKKVNEKKRRMYEQ